MLRILLLVPLLQIFFNGISNVAALCLGVASCGCEASSNNRIVANCRGQRLNHVPAFIPDSTDYYELTLDSNAIRSIEANAFSGIKVRRLVLTNNPISNISANAFEGLEPNLVDISLQIDGSMTFPATALSPLRSLESLEMVGYGEESLPLGAMTSLSKLKTLSLTSGGLRSLTPSDFDAQKSQLSFLNLNGNRFQEIPTSSLAILSSLSEVHLDLNQITTVGPAAFEGVSNLRILDLASNPIGSMSREAFSGLENTLRNLSLQRCHLSNEHLKAIIALTSLVYLDISDNYLDQVSEILANMRFLQVLKASRNQISSLKKTFYSSMSNSLRVLYLDDNPLVDVASDTFGDLGQLQELYLDGAKKLTLDVNSFVSQRNSLQLLSLRSVTLSNSPWSAVSVLNVVRTLWLSSCGLTDIPDFTFSQMFRLENLDLNNNAVSKLTQRSMTGLSNSLVRLYLSGNQLRTIDECVFHKFKKLDVLQLQLSNNPLECTCGLQWLHDRLKPYKSDPTTKFRVMALQWKCANPDGKLFINLSDEDFLNCTKSNPAIECEDLDNITPAEPTFSDIPVSTPTATGNVMLQLSEITHSSVLVTWTV